MLGNDFLQLAEAVSQTGYPDLSEQVYGETSISREEAVLYLELFRNIAEKSLQREKTAVVEAAVKSKSRTQCQIVAQAMVRVSARIQEEEGFQTANEYREEGDESVFGLRVFWSDGKALWEADARARREGAVHVV